MTKPRFTEHQFAFFAKSSRMEAKSLDVARQVLVLGKSQSEVADEHGLSRQWVSEIVKKLMVLAQKLEDIPPGWVKDTAILPLSDWKTVRQLERTARAKRKAARK